MADISILSLRGGMNDTDPSNALREDQCVLAENVEYFYSMLGERRAGCEAVDLTDSGLETDYFIVHLSEWLPTGAVTDPEWWAIGITDAGATIAMASYRSNVWTPITPEDDIDTSTPDIYEITSQPLGGLLFWSYHSAVDRLHVWDGTLLRVTGLAEPDPPTAVDDGAGLYASTRYFRVRFVALNADSEIVRRSEPSESLTFTPSGAGSGAVVTMPALLGEGETDWELEASLDNANFYLINTQVVGTTTYTDTTAAGVGYADQGALSEDIGDYNLIPSVKYLGVEGDRLIGASHWTDEDRKSLVIWTPRSADPGVGNGERIPLDLDNTINLDPTVGGGITGLGHNVAGVWYVFKWSRIYQMIETQDVTRAYAPTCISESNGAIPGTIVPGLDESGQACDYFVDPYHGPSRLGGMGIQTLEGLRGRWSRLNQSALIVGHGVYYPLKRQVKWWISIDGASSPNLEIILHTQSITSQGGVAINGWAIATGWIANTLCSAILSEVVYENGLLAVTKRPYVGMVTPFALQRTDVGTLDGGYPYVAIIRTKPYIANGLLQKWGVMLGGLLATANDGAHIHVKLIRDFGVETTEDRIVDLSPEGDEEMVVRSIDDLNLSAAVSVQIEFSDE